MRLTRLRLSIALRLHNSVETLVFECIEDVLKTTEKACKMNERERKRAGLKNDPHKNRVLSRTTTIAT